MLPCYKVRRRHRIRYVVEARREVRHARDFGTVCNALVAATGMPATQAVGVWELDVELYRSYRAFGLVLPGKASRSCCVTSAWQALQSRVEGWKLAATAYPVVW